MDRVASEFHKNVLILTKFILPHDEFKKCFKEGMFEKPNTLGFIHVSFYLLNIYYKDNVKSKVQWPVICKQTENKFRNDVRECLMAISSDNSDLNFPPIFASHLLLARGTKFLLIMWKFSLVVLRTYLKREYNTVLLTTPKQGPCQEVTKLFLNNVAKDNENTASDIRSERQIVEQEAKNFQRSKSEEQQELKAKILKLRDDIKNIIKDAPVNDAARKQLLNVEDNGIVNMWSNYVDNILESLKDDLQALEERYGFLKSVSNIVSNIKGDLLILNASNFDRINTDPIYDLIPPELQVIPYNLYNKDSLNLQNFFGTFNLLLQKLKANYQSENISDLETEFSKCNLQLQTTNKDLKSAMNSYQNLHEQANNFTLDENDKCNELNETQKNIENIPQFDKVLLMPSPSIQINSYDVGERNNYQNYLKLTPVEGAHKELFSRHAFKDEKGIYSLKKPLFVQRINFDDSTLLESSSDRLLSIPQQRLNTPSKLKSTFKNVDKYSKIFSTRKPAGNRVNNSVMVMMSSTGNSMLPLMTKQHCLSLMDSCNSSQDISQEPLLMNPQLNSTINTSKTEETEKVPHKVNRRRSISDLVERYKKVLQNRDTNSHATNSPTREQLGEKNVV